MSSSSSSRSTSWPTNLPTSLYLEVRQFLTGHGYWKLLITSKVLLTNIKDETRRLCLENRDLEQFINNIDLQRDYLAKIKNPLNQLRLKGSPSISHLLANIPLKCDLDLLFSPFATPCPISFISRESYRDC